MKLFVVSVILAIQAIILIFPLMALFSTANSFFTFAIYTIIAIFVFCAPILFIQGYYWELTSQIIDRSSDIISTNIYAKKVREINKITLPEWDVRKYIWRGFASIIATSIMLIPWLAVICLNISQISLYNMNPAIRVPLICFAFLFYLLVPGLLWNYAKRDSILAPLNIPKAIYLFGTYTGKYILNIVIMFFVYVLDIIITYILDAVFRFSQIITGITDTKALLFSLLIIIPYLILMLVKWLYLVHIHAYLIGTITPVGRE
ncbi:hypothetical protein IKQ21_05710 [bacterium]|nr:hypothetical protein [bacterium]